MKRLLVALVVVAALLVIFAAPVYADQGGEPNGNACFGQWHKNYDPSPGDMTTRMKNAAAGMEMNLGQFIKTVAKPVLCPCPED